MFGFLKRKDKKSKSFKEGEQAGQKIIKTLVDLIHEKMPEVTKFYLDTLSERFDEANGDREKILAAWEGFNAALADAPNVVERVLRDQHAELFAFLREQGIDHLVAGIIRQETAKHTETLPKQIEAEFFASE